MTTTQPPEKIKDNSTNTGHPSANKGAAWVDKSVSQHQILKYLLVHKEKIQINDRVNLDQLILVLNNVNQISGDASIAVVRG